MKNIVVFDLDGVLADFEGKLVKVLVDEFGGVGKIYRDQYSLEKRFEKHPEVLARAQELTNDPNFYYGMKSDEGMVKFVKKFLEDGYIVVFATSRPNSAENFTRRWLDKRFDYGDSTVLVTGLTDKSVYFAEFIDEIEFAFDDSPSQIEKMKSAGINAFCVDQQWNSGVFPRIYIRSDGVPMLWESEDTEAQPFFEEDFA